MALIQDNFWDDCDDVKLFDQQIKILNNSNNNKCINKTQNSTINTSTISLRCKNSTNGSKSVNIKVFHKKKNSMPNIFQTLYIDALTRNYRVNHQMMLTTNDKKNKNDLKECTFTPKITKLRNNSSIKYHIDEYSKYPLLERFKIFKRKKETLQLKKSIRKIVKSVEKYNYMPKINKCLDFEKIKKNNYDDYNRTFYQRMENSRTLRENDKKNKLSRSNYYGENSILRNYSDCKEKKNYHNRNLSHEINYKKYLTQREIKEYEKYIHSELMTIRYNDEENNYIL